MGIRREEGREELESCEEVEEASSLLLAVSSSLLLLVLLGVVPCLM